MQTHERIIASQDHGRSTMCGRKKLSVFANPQYVLKLCFHIYRDIFQQIHHKTVIVLQQFDISAS